MSTNFSKEKNYESLCTRFGEEPQYVKNKHGDLVLDWNGKHATSLKQQDCNNMGSFFAGEEEDDL